MPDRLRLVHCSDIHLGGDEYSADAENPRDLFARALHKMRAHDPDLMLIAGDLFDSNRTEDETVLWSMEALADLPFPIFMIPGNHDCMQPNGVFGRYNFNAIENMQMLSAPGGETVWDEGLGVAVWGKGMEEHSPSYRPLGDCPLRPEGCRWYLGMGHGIFVADGDVTDRSSPIAMQEIAESPCDYLALGHHHAAMELVTDTTLAAFSGSPTDDIGRGATYALVELTDNDAPSLEILTID
ncbi:MAG TPA: hypothetical protein DCS82_06190 [Rhodospirillaceae bacterium]|nr:hypothetical protein [Rhodospirillaceae bacterium]HAA93252.1 hypothetical protein [Rhodospirillaceae bacterium]HAT35286.1 hypothetical protein [Rhodospirillaceae bacterium]